MQIGKRARKKAWFRCICKARSIDFSVHLSNKKKQKKNEVWSGGHVSAWKCVN